MKFAVVEGERREVQPGFPAECPLCGNAMIAKCGEYRVWHWAHRGTRTCDHWWERETEWHRAWKNLFPKDWQEIIQTSKDDEKHIADVKSEHGVVLEFQHSPLSRDERESREVFYQNMVWVVDGRRHAKNKARNFRSLGTAMVVNPKLTVFSAPPNEGAGLREWEASRVPVYFDFGDSEPSDRPRFDEPVLWRLSPRDPNGRAYLSVVSKTLFVRMHRTGLPSDEMTYTTDVERTAAEHVERYMPGRQRKRAFF